MKSIETVSNFVVPSARVELDGQLGLTVHEIAQSLGTQHREVKEAVEREWENLIELTVRAITPTVPAGFTTKEVESYVLSVPAAQFIVARFGNKIGAAYCKYLIQQTQTLEQMEKGCEESPELALKFAEAVKNRALAALEAKKAKEIAAHALKALTSSQQNNAAGTRDKKKLLETIAVLKEEVGDGYNYKSVKMMMEHLPVNTNLSTLGKLLKKTSLQMGIAVKKVRDANYGEVNTYHAKVWTAVLNKEPA